jgi:integrase/recombinase XerD
VYSVSNSHDTENFFARKNGKAIEPRLLLRAFESVRRRMGVSRVDGMGRQPRLRDLRRTVAVHCLKAWIDQKKDLRKMLPILAAYLGHVNLASTEEYLLLAPDRFRKQLSTLSPTFLQECWGHSRLSHLGGMEKYVIPGLQAAGRDRADSQ